MKKKSSFLLSLLCMPFFMATMQPVSNVTAFDPDTREGVVVVYTYIDNTDLGGTGTGFFVGADGEQPTYLITNYHVVDLFVEYGAGEPLGIDGVKIGRGHILVCYDSNDYEEAYYVAGDEIKDIAILKLDHSTSKRRPLHLCKPTDDMVGSSIYAVGYPGLAETIVDPTTFFSQSDATVTSGTISRLFTTSGTGRRNIQIDCVIRHGNSGGPLVNENGSVLGVTTFSIGDGEEQIFYAVNIEEVIPFLTQYGIDYVLDSPELPAQVDPVPSTPDVIYEDPEPTTNWGLVSGIGGAVLIAGVGTAIALNKKKQPAGAGANIPQNSIPVPQKLPQPVVRSVTGQTTSVGNGQILIGRSAKDCALAFPEGTPGISGRHCSLSWDSASGEFILTDLRSTYGTFLMNGQQLTAGVPYRLKAKTSFYLGERSNILTVDLE